jgi:hypothetical protein
MPRATYFHDVTVEAHEDQTLLDVSIRNRIPHELHRVVAGEGKELEAAILFSDIRNFTAQSEKNLPTTSCTS